MLCYAMTLASLMNMLHCNIAGLLKVVCLKARGVSCEHLASFNGSHLLGVALLLVRFLLVTVLTLILGFLPGALAPPEVLLEALAQHLSAAAHIMSAGVQPGGTPQAQRRSLGSGPGAFAPPEMLLEARAQHLSTAVRIVPVSAVHPKRRQRRSSSL